MENHILHNQLPPYDNPIHPVAITKDTMLHTLLCKEEIMVNSIHHQSVLYVPECLKVSAVSPNNIIEAYEMRNEKFVVGLQWHPECMYDKDEDSQKIFKAFIAAAAKG